MTSARRVSAARVAWIGLCLSSCGGSGGGGGNPPGPTSVSTPAVISPTPAPTPTPVASAPPTGNRPPAPQFRVTQQSSPALTIEANLCQSTDPDGDALHYRFAFGDGSSDNSDFCRPTHTYRDPGRFTVEGCVTDSQPGHEVCETQAVNVTAPQPASLDVRITDKGSCMVDISVDVPAGLAVGDVVGLAVTKVSLTLQRSSNRRMATASRDGSTNVWRVQGQSISGLGTGSLSVDAEASDASNRVVGSGNRAMSVSCSS